MKPLKVPTENDFKSEIRVMEIEAKI